VFTSFFPKPRLLLLSTIVFTIVAVGFWYTACQQFVATPVNAEPVIGLDYFLTPQFLWFYAYYAICSGAFAAFWFWLSPHRWQWWSIVGSMLILFSTYFSVEVAVAVNNWRRPFFDAVQNALSAKSTTTAIGLYAMVLVFAQIAFVWMIVYVFTRYFVSHYVFRWRTAMNDYYISRWSDIRRIEGAAQRVQEDTMRFASIMEDLGVSIIGSVMTLFAFLPVLFSLSQYVVTLPLVGKIPAPLVNASIFWAIFGTSVLAIVGIKLPGLNFRNQRVEAAYRKELVYGEDDRDRALPMTVADLYSNVRANYFRLYFHYAYFNVFRGMYLQADTIFAYLILVPTIAAGAITFGILQQILTAFGQVSHSFQYLVTSWTTIIELLSIQKRLAAFEAAFSGQTLPEIDREPLDPGASG
jgi:peptide/bleomycin uptake transporter